MITDETLYCSYLEGDEDGLTVLIERYGNSLVFYLNGYLCNINDAEDLMIEAFAYLIVKKPRIRKNFKAYLFKTARHLALRFLAKNRRHCFFGFDELWKEPKSEILIEELIQKEERNRILHLCIKQLNPNYCEALYLVYFENMRHAEVAAVMGKSKKQVADLVYRGKRSLRKRLEEEGISYAEY